jgi:outer membrane lipoprotein SlyB
MKSFTLFLIASIAIGGCAANPTQDTYLGSELGMGQVTDMGEIVAVRPVTIERTGQEDETFNTIATGVGAVLGIAIAVLTGSPDVVKWMAAAAGGAAGFGISEASDSTDGVEYIIARDDGSFITVVTPIESDVLASGSEVIVVMAGVRPGRRVDRSGRRSGSRPPISNPLSAAVLSSMLTRHSAWDRVDGCIGGLSRERRLGRPRRV